jgi:WD40 repeat protein
MSEDSLEGYGGVLAAPARPGWRTVLDVIGILDIIAAAVLATVVVTHHGSAPGCQTLTPPAASQHVRAVAFSPDGRTLATAGAGGRTYLWDVGTGRLIATLSGPFTGASGASVAFSPDGTMLAVVDGSGIADVWDVTTDRLVAALAPDDRAESVAFSPDGRTLAVGDNSGHAYLCPMSGGPFGRHRSG